MPSPTDDPEGIPAALQGPEHGHTFRITYAGRGSYGDPDGGHHDEPEWPGPDLYRTVEVRAWNLRDALVKASLLPFPILMGEPLPDHPYEQSDASLGDACVAMVMRDGGGDQCGLPRRVHPTAEAAE